MGIFDNAESVFINNKEVQSIILTDSGGVLYEKQMLDSPIMTLTVTGSSFSTASSTPFVYNGRVFVDWGDNSGLTEYNGGQLSHTFNDGLNSHTVKVYGELTSLEGFCFYSCTGLISITIPNGVISIGVCCFQYCTGLTSITLPDSITSLDGGCFYGCTGLTSITLPDSITILKQSCFENCTNLTSIILNWTGTDILPYNFQWIPNVNSNLKFKIPPGTTQLYIDKGYPADKLEEQQPCMTLTVTGLSFSTYSSTPFVYNDKVFVDWGDNSGLTEYNGGQLSHTFNDGLNSHTVKVYGDLTSLGDQCFFRCAGLTSITIPNSVTSIRGGCFYGCTGLTSITIPDSITSIGGSCFWECTSLTSITIPDSITSIEDTCFVGCTSLTSITIPNSVTSLGTQCFNGCSNLASITIPDSVTNIGLLCFYGCTGLTSIILNWIGTDILTFNYNWTRDTNDNLKFKIPVGTKQLYIDKSYPEDKLEEKVT